MAKKSYGKKPLEWVFNSIQTTDQTVTQDRIELGLKDDEVAEIHKIDSVLAHGPLDDAANEAVYCNMMLSMDPDIVADPAVAANHEDLEVFYENQKEAEMLVGAAGSVSVSQNDNKRTDRFDPPILVGTDVGHVFHCESTGEDITGQSWVRLYFTRRKANVMELNQILLKRR